jgi:protoporphyrinogen oxidase
MAWLWHRIHWRGNSRNKSGTGEELVYLEGGFKILIDKLVEEIKNNGGKIYTKAQVKKISPVRNQQIRLSLKDIFKGSALKNNLALKTRIFEKCIATVPNPIFVKMTPSLPKEIKRKLLKVRYRGAMVAVLQLKEKFMKDIYWLNIHEEEMKLLAVVEHTNFVSPRYYGGKHLLYAGNYPAQEDSIMDMSEDELSNSLTRELKLINNRFDKSWVKEYWIFRDKYAQPIITTDYYKYIPPVETGIPNLYLVNMAQVYPEDRGVNQAIRDGKKIADSIL